MFGSYVQCDYCGNRIDSDIVKQDGEPDLYDKWVKVRCFNDWSPLNETEQQICGECWEKALIAMTPVQTKKARMNP